MYELEIKYNGNPIAKRNYVEYADVAKIIKRIDYSEMFIMLGNCLTFEKLLADNDATGYKAYKDWRNVITCNVVYYDDNDATMVYEVYRMEVRI